MQVNNFAKFIAFPFIILSILNLTTDWSSVPSLRWLVLIPSVVILSVIFVFHKEINIWWYRFRPPTLDAKIKTWILTFSPYFNSLSSSEKLRFSERLATFMAVKEFTLKGKQDYKLEEDIKALISHEFVRISMGMNDYLGQDFEQFIIYNHPFATPKYKFLHTLELYHEDGVIILSKPDLIKGFQNKAGFLNLALFAAISAFISLHPRADYPELKHIDESQLETTFNIEFEAIKKALGFDWLNKLNVLIYCFFEFPRIFEATFPKEFFSLQSIFND